MEVIGRHIEKIKGVVRYDVLPYDDVPSSWMLIQKEIEIEDKTGGYLFEYTANAELFNNKVKANESKQ